jgi:hypothetical protein
MNLQAVTTEDQSRRVRRVPVRDSISDIVSTFRKMSTESDQAHSLVSTFEAFNDSPVEAEDDTPAARRDRTYDRFKMSSLYKWSE